MLRTIRTLLRSARPIAWVCALAVIGTGIAPALAAPQSSLAPVLPGAGSLDSPDLGRAGASHGWMVVQSGDTLALIHIPPRTSAQAGASGVLAAGGGSVRLVMPLERSPEGIAAIDERVYLAFDVRDSTGQLIQREVRSVAAIRSGLGALWRFEPAADLLTHPVLPTSGRLLGMGAAGQTLVAIMSERSRRGESSPVIHALDQDRWREAQLPDELAGLISGQPSPLRVVSMRGGVGLAVASSRERLDVWVGQVRFPRPTSSRRFGDFDDGPVLTRPANPRPVEAPPEEAPEWTWTRRSLSLDPAQVDVIAAGTLLECSGAMVWVEPIPGGRVRLTELTEAGSFPIATIDGVAPPVTAASLDGDGRIALVWSQLDEPGSEDSPLKPSSPKRRYEVREISAHTGRVLYAGPAKSLGPVSPTDLRLLSTALLATMGVVLLLVLRPDPSDGVVTIPPGFALAEAGRRFFAALADTAMALWISSVLWGIDMGTILSPDGMIGGETWVVVGSGIGIAIVMGTIGEWRTGRSPGKLLTGCEVISIARTGLVGEAGHVPRPGFWRALERNVLKWLLPPMAMLGLFDQQGRHRADMMARTLVVVRWEEDQDQDES